MELTHQEEECMSACDSGMGSSIVSPYDATNDQCSWYAVRLFSMKHACSVDYIRHCGLTYFVPLDFSFVSKGKKEPKQILRPIIFNLLFIKKDRDEKEIRKIISEAAYKMAIIRKDSQSNELYEIPSRQMLEFMLMCSPQFTMKKYITEADARIKAGTPVYVKYGSLKGMSGKLVRQNKKYFLLKEVPGMAVMIKVSRWCCVPLEEEKN